MLRTMLISLSSIIAIGAVTSSAFAGCNLDGDLIVAYQSNGPVSYFTNIRQRGIDIQGSAKYGTMRGDFQGILDNGRLSFNVVWDDGVVGNYTGFVTPDGRVLDGRAHQVGNNTRQLGNTSNEPNWSNAATWNLGHKSNRLQCG